MKTNNLLLDTLALISGAILTLAFAPFNIFPLAVISPALLLLTLLNTSQRRAFWRGLLYGIGLFGTGVYWIFISVHTFGNTSLFLASLITGGLIGVLALFPAMNGYLLNRYFPVLNSTKIICAFPAIWLLLEWTRSWIFTGFPWLYLGYTQINSPLKGYAPIFSVYGVSLAVLISGSLLLNAIIKFKQKKYKSVYLHLFSFALIWIIGCGLSLVSWTKPSGEPIKVSLVQGNISQDLKWSADQVQPTLDHYQDLTKPHWDSKIIIWPESAIPLPMHNAMDFLGNMANMAGEHKTTFITGIPMRATDKEGYYNAVIAMGSGEGIYTKHRLVPFGEYVPMRQMFGQLLDLLQVPMSDFIPGQQQIVPLTANGIKIATFICYEIAFPEQVLSSDSNTGILLTVSNDAWFGHSIAQAQHIEMAEMRALEMGRPVLFVANDGITAIINAFGKIQSAAPQHESYVLTDRVQAMFGKTPWQRIGMDPILGITLALLIIAIRRRKYS